MLGCWMLDRTTFAVSSIRHRASSIRPKHDRPAAKRIADWRALYPFASHWVDVPGGRMHYVDEGPIAAPSDAVAPTLLFVHGNPTWSFHWRRLIEALRGRLSLRGAGSHRLRAERQAAAILDAGRPHRQSCRARRISLDLERVTLVAQDWGGAIGLGAMLRMPERLEADRAVQHRRVSAAIHSVANSRVPHADRWPARRARRESVQPGGAADDAGAAKRLEPAVAAGYLAPYDSWANRRAVYGFVRDIPPRRSVRRSDRRTRQQAARRDRTRAADARRSAGVLDVGHARLVLSARLPGAFRRSLAAGGSASAGRRRPLGRRRCAGRIAGASLNNSWPQTNAIDRRDTGDRRIEVELRHRSGN